MEKSSIKGEESMSSMSGEYRCTECGSENCHKEEFNDDESGHIISCND